MKSEAKNNPAQAFVEDNHFVKQVVVYHKNKTLFFPTPDADKQRYFEDVLAEQKNETASVNLFIQTPKAYIYIYKKDKSIYICESSNDVSVSQVKMEFDAFIEESQKQGKFPRFITSLFDR